MIKECCVNEPGNGIMQATVSQRLHK